jgi:hypothetical protein
MKLGFSEILKLAAEQKTEEDKIQILRQHGSEQLCTLINLAFDKNAPWDLPEGDPPYTPNPYPDQQNRLQAEFRRLYLFMKGGNDNLSKTKRESLFIGLLESIDPEDAKLLLAVKSNKLPYKGLPKSLFAKAWYGRIRMDEPNDNKAEVV